VAPHMRIMSLPCLFCVCLQGAPPTYFIVAGLVFTVATVPYLRSEYGKEYDYEAPVSRRGGCAAGGGGPKDSVGAGARERQGENNSG
jgi:hypothetical protein